MPWSMKKSVDIVRKRWTNHRVSNVVKTPLQKPIRDVTDLFRFIWGNFNVSLLVSYSNNSNLELSPAVILRSLRNFLS